MNQKDVETWMAAGVGRRLDCGDGLYLSRNGVKGDRFSWTYIWKKNGKRHETGLGQYRTSTTGGADAFKLREARFATAGLDQVLRDGKDVTDTLRAEKKAAEAVGKTFGDVAKIYVRDVGSRRWKHDRQRKEFERVIATYCKSLVNMPVADVAVSDVKKVLQPWVKSRPTMVNSTASVIRRVLDTAIAHEFRPLGVNPASEDVLSKVLVVRHETQHFMSMPWQKVPAYYKTLSATGGEDYRADERSVIRCALKLLILTALRKIEVTGLRWSEVDLKNCTLTIAAERMKGGREHIVPLSRQACELLRDVQQRHTPDSEFVFPSSRRASYVGKKGSHIGPGAFNALLPQGKGGGRVATSHGFRATFRTWCEDHGIDERLAEHALAHSVGDGVQKAYRRSTAVERRRELMQQWADYVAGVII